MKVILLHDDAALGKRGTIVTVSDGFAFNNLIPRGIAKAATARVIKEAQARDRRRQVAMKKNLAQRRALAEQLSKKKITITAKAKGHKLFGSVTAKDIVAAISAQCATTVTEEMILLDAPIKELTTREVRIDFGDAITSSVILTVTPA